MTKQIILFIATIAIITGIIGAYFYTTSNSQDIDSQVNKSSNPQMATDLDQNPGSNLDENSNNNLNQDSIVKYASYDPALLRNSEKNVLFFKARWCSTCNGLEEDIQKNINNIPEDVQILTVDYDAEVTLVSNYKVRIQHTLVQVEQDGAKVKSWVGSPTLSSLLSEVL